jgi:hypothetical protein
MGTILKKIVIDHNQVAATLRDFPVLLEMSLEGAVELQDVGFLAADQATSLDHEISTFDPETRALSVWVRAPQLSATAGTILFLAARVVGEHPRPGGNVWDDHYRLVGEGGGRRSVSESVGVTEEITVEAWVECEEPLTEATQSVVSQWSVQDSFSSFDAYDASRTSGLDTTGFFGAVFDGRYLYFVPQHDTVSRHGKVLRYDTQGVFHDPVSWLGYDAGATGGLNTKGYYGAVFDGRSITFIPRRDSEDFHSRFLRYDTRGGFTDPASWSAHDAGLPNSYQSAAFDGRYIYCSPGQRSVPADAVDQHDEGHAVTGMKAGTVPKGSGLVLRIDTRMDASDPARYQTCDASESHGEAARDFDGAIHAGPYIYFAPLSYGQPLRYDTRLNFGDTMSWAVFDARPLGLVRNVGAVFDGRYVYYAPYGETEFVVRHDTFGEFTDAASWSSYDMKRTSGKTRLGYDGACFDGRHVYFVPYWDGAGDFHGEMLRYDTLGEFADPESWHVFDASRTEGLLTVGFNGAAFDGRYIYCAPWNDGAKQPGLHGHGAVLRYDTLGSGGGFSLLYSDCGHNGGLCAALPGPRFLVATTTGVVSVAANREMPAGRHHLAGVYDGSSIKLYIDGQLANEQRASGRIQAGDGMVTVGCRDGGVTRFRGVIGDIRVSDIARDAAWLATEYANRQAPRSFAVEQAASSTLSQ